jgi:hypothetical protein
MTTPPLDPDTAAWLDHLSLVKDSYLPRLRIDSDIAWEVILPETAFADTDLENVTITPDGLYIENEAGDWDIIPFAELSAVLNSADCRNIDERLDVVSSRQAIIAKLGNTVRSSTGQPGYVATGQQRILAAIAPTDRSL